MTEVYLSSEEISIRHPCRGRHLCLTHSLPQDDVKLYCIKYARLQMGTGLCSLLCLDSVRLPLIKSSVGKPPVHLPTVIGSDSHHPNIHLLNHCFCFWRTEKQRAHFPGESGNTPMKIPEDSLTFHYAIKF